ncbi:hypothetical protein [Ferruginibacter sp.]
MKKIFIILVFSINVAVAMAQKETFDIVSYTAPATWAKDLRENLVSYTTTDKKNNTWCQVAVVKSTISKGSIEADFDSEWQELIVKPYKPSDPPAANDVQEADGWKIKAGGSKFTFNNANAIAMLTTLSGYNRCVSIVAITNSQAYLQQVQDFIGSVDLSKPDVNTNTGNASSPVNTDVPKAAISTGYTFNSSNFDDGWTSTVQEDWVEVTKANMKVLLHYPKEGTVFPADPGPLTTAAWNILVAPRYSNLKNFKTTYINTYERPYIGMASATDNSTGKEVFLVLFRQGGSGWIEFVSPDKNSFINAYKFDPETIRWDSESDLMKPMAKMASYNKFAVGAKDLKGKWTSDFTGIQQLYNVYTGNYAGMHVNQSAQTFVFGAGNTYKWDIMVVNGMVGNSKFIHVKSDGKFSVPNNWQISCSDIEGKPKLYDAYFTCIKGARMLWMNDAKFPGSGVFTGYGLAK